MTRTTRRRFLAGVGALALAGSVPSTGVADATRSGARAPGGRTFPDRDRLASFVDDLLADRIGDNVPGAAVAVVQGDDVALAKGYGVADVETEAPVRADETSFRIGSVGKLLTWTAVMQGVEDGLLALDRDVNDYLADSPVAVPDTFDDPVTLRHLGTHTAGFESGLNPGIASDPGDLTSLETALVENRPERVRPPGEAVGYSNYGAMLAGHVVAETRDTPFEEYVRSAILEPLGMDHTTFAQPVPDDHPGTQASPHTGGGGSFATPDPVYVNWRPAGSTTATATDMAAFMQAHLGGGTVDDAEILGPEAVRTMHGPQYERHPAVNDWRFGFYEYGPPDAGLIAHSGGTVYFRSLLVLAPERDVGVFVAENVRNDDSPPSAVVDAVLDEYDLVPDAPTPPATTGPATRSRAERVAGEYRGTMFPRGGPVHLAGRLARLTVSPAADGLVTEPVAGEPREWVETAPYVYHERDGADVLAFDVEDGDVAALHVSSEPQGTYVPVPARDRTAVTGAVLGGTLVGFAGSLVGRGGWSLWRRWQRRGTETDDAAEPDPQTPARVDPDGRVEGER